MSGHNLDPDRKLIPDEPLSEPLLRSLGIAAVGNPDKKLQAILEALKTPEQRLDDERARLIATYEAAGFTITDVLIFPSPEPQGQRPFDMQGFLDSLPAGPHRKEEPLNRWPNNPDKYDKYSDFGSSTSSRREGEDFMQSFKRTRETVLAQGAIARFTTLLEQHGIGNVVRLDATRAIGEVNGYHGADVTVFMARIVVDQPEA